jgi:hypothetical protein
MFSDCDHRAGTFVRAEELRALESKWTGDDDARDAFDLDVVRLHRAVVVIARVGDLVLGVGGLEGLAQEVAGRPIASSISSTVNARSTSFLSIPNNRL